MKYLVAGDVRQGGELRQEVLIFAASDQTIREQLRLLESAHCQPVGLDAQPVALVRGMNYFWPVDRRDPDGVRVLADLGASHCNVIITRGESIIFVKTIEIGSADMSRAVTDKVGTSMEDTQALRERLSATLVGGEGSDSLGEDSKIRRAVTAAMRPVVERLGHEISLCLRYFSVTFRGNRPEQVMLVGGAAHDNVVTAMLAESMGTGVQIGRPLALCEPDWTTCQWGSGPEFGGPEWAVALGCCLKPLTREKRDDGQEEEAGQADSAPAEEFASTAAELNS